MILSSFVREPSPALSGVLFLLVLCLTQQVISVDNNGQTTVYDPNILDPTTHSGAPLGGYARHNAHRLRQLPLSLPPLLLTDPQKEGEGQEEDGKDWKATTTPPQIWRVTLQGVEHVCRAFTEDEITPSSLEESLTSPPRLQVPKSSDEETTSEATGDPDDTARTSSTAPVRKTLQGSSSVPEDSSKLADSVISMLRGMCGQLHSGWWSYEWCAGSTVTQFHVAVSERGAQVTIEGVATLGKFASRREIVAVDDATASEKEETVMPNDSSTTENSNQKGELATTMPPGAARASQSQDVANKETDAASLSVADNENGEMVSEPRDPSDKDSDGVPAQPESQPKADPTTIENDPSEEKSPDEVNRDEQEQSEDAEPEKRDAMTVQDEKVGRLNLRLVEEYTDGDICPESDEPRTVQVTMQCCSAATMAKHKGLLHKGGHRVDGNLAAVISLREDPVCTYHVSVCVPALCHRDGEQEEDDEAGTRKKRPPSSKTGQTYAESDSVQELLDFVLEDVCIRNNENSWWSYEFCHKDSIRQFHEVLAASSSTTNPNLGATSVSMATMQISKSIEGEHWLGHFLPDDDDNVPESSEAEESAVVDNPKTEVSWGTFVPSAKENMSQDTSSTSSSPAPEGTGGNGAYFEVEYTKGDVCDDSDVTDRAVVAGSTDKQIRRASTVRYYCGKEYFIKVHEESTCHYEVNVMVPELCEHPLFMAPVAKRRVFKCLPA